MKISNGLYWEVDCILKKHNTLKRVNKSKVIDSLTFRGLNNSVRRRIRCQLTRRSEEGLPKIGSVRVL